MKTLVLGVTLALLCATASQAIDCAKADNDLDHAICNNPELLKADDAMNAAYKSALKAMGPKMAKALKADAVEWAEYRFEDCAGNSGEADDKPEDTVQCLIDDTNRRLSFLSGMPLEGPGYGEAMIPQVLAGADEVFDEYVTFAAPKGAAAKAFNTILKSEIKDLKIAKTDDHTSDYYQLVLAYASPDLLSFNVDRTLEEGYAHPIVDNYAINIDGKTGKRLVVTDAFDSAAIKQLEGVCEAQMTAYISAGEEGADIRQGQVDTIVDDLDFWTFGASKATLRYTEYGMDSPATCELGYDVLKPLAKASFPLPH